MKNKGIVKELLRQGLLRSPLLEDAFANIDRAYFVPEAGRTEAHENVPISVGHAQFMSQPYTVAFMLDLLEPKAGEKILDIGAGTGWQTALLAHVTSNKASESSQRGKVIALELLEPLVEIATKNVEHYHFISEGLVKIIQKDAAEGVPEEAPFDKIIASVASEKIPRTWKDQLRVGGRIVAPAGESIIVLDKIGPNSFSKRRYFGFDFAPIVE